MRRPTPHIALVGDYSPEIVAHRAIPQGLELARRTNDLEATWAWVRTDEIHDPARDLAEFSAIWVVPGSPYENMGGALDAIRWARESKKPFLGTCGGFQHAIIEFCRNVAGLSDADHAESNPAASRPVISRLACPLVEKTGAVHFLPGSRLRAIYGRDSATEEYQCSFSINSDYRRPLEQAGMVFSAQDDAGDARALELPSASHPFFIGTLFQSERAALRGETPPLAGAFLAAAVQSVSEPVGGRV